MTDATLLDQSQTTPASQAVGAADASCEECVGTGGWFRYQPGQDDAPATLYLSCLCCQGSGRTPAQG